LSVRAEDIAEGIGTIANNITCGCDARLPYLYLE